MNKQISVEEIRAAAETATTTKLAAEAAKKAWDAAQDDESLKSAYETAQKAADDAKAKVDALSQAGTSKYTPEQIQKMKRRKAIIESELEKAGASDEDDDDDIDPLEVDPDKPLTMRDLQRIEAKKASETAMQMADGISDTLAREAVKAALRRIVPSGNPQQDFTDAVAIANREKNSKILEEIARKPTPPQHRSGPGSPPPPLDEAFVPTAEEQRFMNAFGLTKEQIIAARPKK